MRFPIGDSADSGPIPRSARASCYYLFIAVGFIPFTPSSRTVLVQLSDSRSPHCCRNLKQISCTRGVAFFCPAKLDKHSNYSFEFRTLVCGYFLCIFAAVYEAERVLRRPWYLLNDNNVFISQGRLAYFVFLGSVAFYVQHAIFKFEIG